jgi:hypothetical protein
MKHIMGTALRVAGCVVLLGAGVALVAGKDDIRKFNRMRSARPRVVFRVNDRASPVAHGNFMGGDHSKRHVADSRSLIAHSRARLEWPEPSTPTTMRGASSSGLLFIGSSW